jgi:hypothetical protein
MTGTRANKSLDRSGGREVIADLQLPIVDLNPHRRVNSDGRS